MKAKADTYLGNRSGASIVEALVAVSIMVISGFVMASMLAAQQKQIKLLEQKQDILDLKNTLMQTLQNPATCDCLLNISSTGYYNDAANTSALQFNSSVVDGSQSMNIPKLRSGCGASPVLIEMDKKLTSGLIVNKIVLGGLKPAGTSNIWTGEWTVGFANKAGPLKDLKLSQTFNIDLASPAANTRISGCITSADFAGLPVGNHNYTHTGSGTVISDWALPDPAAKQAYIYSQCSVKDQNGYSTMKVGFLNAAGSLIYEVKTCFFIGDSDHTGGFGNGTLMPIPLGAVKMRFTGIGDDGSSKQVTDVVLLK